MGAKRPGAAGRGKGFLAEEEVVGGIAAQAAPVLLVDVLQRAAEPVVIVSVGGLSNAAEALRQTPTIKSKIRRRVIMDGSVRPFMMRWLRTLAKQETGRVGSGRRVDLPC